MEQVQLDVLLVQGQGLTAWHMDGRMAGRGAVTAGKRVRAGRGLGQVAGVGARIGPRRLRSSLRDSLHGCQGAEDAGP